MVDTSAYRIREATLADLGRLAEARHAMFVDLGDAIRTEDRDLVAQLLADYITQHVDEGPIGFIAEDASGEMVGAVSITYESVQPSLHNPSARQAYLSGMWVRPESRRQGVARSLVATAVEAARAAGAGAVTLMASEAGRAVYSSLGFVAVPAMRLSFEPLFDPQAHGNDSH
jgi:predicted N-acetyltransferase YhbS